MLASIVIITKNQKRLLQITLPTLLSQKFSGKYEIIIVDSGSTDGAIDYLRSLPVSIIQISPDHFNYASAFNQGAERAKGDFLIRLSGDCIPMKENWLTEMLKPFVKAKVGATYGRYTISGKKGYRYPAFWPDSRFPDELKTYSVRQKFFMGIIELGKERDILFNLAGGCCAIRKRIWEKRPYNKKMSAAEDAEYAWFLHLIGYDIVYNPEAIVLHEHKISTLFDKSYKQIFKEIRWRMEFNFEIGTYWLLRLFLIDPYKNFG